MASYGFILLPSAFILSANGGLLDKLVFGVGVGGH
jgi:hypothetical protein